MKALHADKSLLADDTLHKNVGEISQSPPPPMAKLAHDITAQPWPFLGLGPDPEIAASDDPKAIIERIVSLLLVRIVALVSIRKVGGGDEEATTRSHGLCVDGRDVSKSTQYRDLSTTTITAHALENGSQWPAEVTADVIDQLREYVTRICTKYHAVPYHNVRHAYHVVISANKLLDLMLCDDTGRQEVPPEVADYGINNASTPSERRMNNGEKPTGMKREGGNANGRVRPTYGIKSDPLTHVAFLFSALMHDVDHQGVSNQQLVLESDDLAILYNDQSPAEQRSLAVAFSLLMLPEFETLRQIMFENRNEYVRFRKTVINLVLTTDIASPERIQIVKSKWKEAFGETAEALKRKERREKALRKMEKAVLERTSTANTTQSEPPTGVQIRNDRESWKYEPAPEGLGEPHQKQLVTEFFRGRVSMGLGYPESIDQNPEDTSTGGGRPSAATPLPTRNHGGEWQEMEDDDSFHLDSSGESIAATPDTIEMDLHEDGSADDPYDGVVQTGVTLSAKKNADERTASALLGGVRALHVDKDGVPRHNISFGSETTEKQRGDRSAVLKSGISFGSAEDRRPEASVAHAMAKNAVASMRKPTNAVADLKKSGVQRRFSAPCITKPKTHEFRLGIRRALDFTGNAIEAFTSPRQKLGSASHHSSATLGIDWDPDEPDELKASVVLEQMMKAADVSALLQGWENIKLWSARLFVEQKVSFVQGRGVDPGFGWFENQITFFDSYVLPLARRLADIGVFDEDVSAMFELCVEENRRRWLEEGYMMTEKLESDWRKEHMSQN